MARLKGKAVALASAKLTSLTSANADTFIGAANVQSGRLLRPGRALCGRRKTANIALPPRADGASPVDTEATARHPCAKTAVALGVSGRFGRPPRHTALREVRVAAEPPLRRFVRLGVCFGARAQTLAGAQVVSKSAGQTCFACVAAGHHATPLRACYPALLRVASKNAIVPTTPFRQLFIYPT